MALSDSCSDFVTAIEEASSLEDDRARKAAWGRAVADLRQWVDRYCEAGYPIDYEEEGAALRSGLQQVDEAGDGPEYKEAIERLVSLAALVRTRLDTYPSFLTW